MALPPFFDRVSLAVAGALSAPAATRASLAEHLETFVVEVRCGAVSPRHSDEWVAELLVNLLSRLYPTIRITAPTGLDLKLERIAQSINPLVDLESTAAANVVVGIGDAVVPVGGAITARSDGWVARVSSGTISAPRGPPNPYSAAAAACFTAAEVFRRAFAGAVPPADRDEISLSLLDYSADAGELDVVPASVDVGEVAFAGIGAVASGGLWGLARHVGVRGEVHLIDPQLAELSNLQRYVLLEMSSVDKPKVKVAAKAIERPGLTVKMHRKTLEAIAGERSRGFQTILVSVDNVDGRRSAQALLPRLAINGWTRDTGMGVSWHRFGNGAPCLACLYMPQGKPLSQSEVIAVTLGLEPREAIDLYLRNGIPSDEQLNRIVAKARLKPEDLAAWRGRPVRELFTAVCGAANLNLREDGQPEAVPLAHQSALAGVLMAAELVKRAVPDLATRAQMDNVVAWHDVTGPIPAYWAEPFRPDARCICSDRVYRDAYRTKWQDVNGSHNPDSARDVGAGHLNPLAFLETVDGT